MTHGFSPTDRLADREQEDLRRHLNPAETVASETRLADDPKGGPIEFGDPELVFAANNYLGLATDSRVGRAAETAARTVGTGAGASRLVTGDTALHRALESDLADCKGTERALAFSSGYAANVGTIDALAPDVVFSDELNHASIIDGCRIAGGETIVYDHCDPADLRRQMEQRDEDSKADQKSWLVVTDTVFSMDGDLAPLSDICDVAEAFGAWVLVDEAHATGVIGETGGGVVERQGVGDRVDVQLGTLSKALAAQGGYVAGSDPLIELLVNEARTFVFSTGLAPPAVGAAREALRIAREGDRRADLWETVDRLRTGLEAAGFTVRGGSHILPVMVGDRADALALEAAVRERGIVAPAIRPPTVPEGASRLRVAPTATHSETEIDRCIEAFRAAGQEVDLL